MMSSDHQHPLGAAKAPKGRIRHPVGFGHVALQVHMGNVVGVVYMEHGPQQHRGRQIHTPARIAVEIELQSQEFAAVVEAHFVASQKAVALAGNHHVLMAAEADPGGLSGFERGQGRDRSHRVRLGLLPAKAAPHAQAGHHHPVVWQVSTSATVCWVDEGCWVEE
jgi:hypothetical protein